MPTRASTSLKKKQKILVVEDEPSHREAICAKLRKEGYTYYEAKNGIEGLALAYQKHPDLILVDMVMPKMGGIEMLQALRADSWGKNARVIVLSNLGDSQKAPVEMSTEKSNFLVKSDWKISDVMVTIKERLKD